MQPIVGLDSSGSRPLTYRQTTMNPALLSAYIWCAAIVLFSWAFGVVIDMIDRPAPVID